MKIFRVGGAIRDSLLGLEPKDHDFVIVGATVDELEASGFEKTVGADFPVFIKDGDEFALARTERKVGLGHTAFETKFDPSVTLEEDLMRRDLTINAMAEDLETGEIIDPFGGRRDLDAGILRHVSDAFAEDPLRVLRVARFSARLGFVIAPETVKLMRHIASHGELRELSRERVWVEMSRAIMECEPQNFFRVLRDVGALSSLFGTSSEAFDNVDQRLMVMASNELTEVQRWMGLFFDVQHIVAERFSNATKMPNEIWKAISFACDFMIINVGDAESLMRFLNRWGQWHSQERLNELNELLSIVDSDTPDLDSLIVAVAEAGLINFASLPSEEQESLEGPAIGLAISDMRQVVIERWVTAA